MSREPEKKHVFIYLVAIIHWMGAGITIGLISHFLNLSALAVACLLVVTALFLPPIFRVVDGKDLDDE